MMTDYLSSRQNVIQAPITELNAKLEAIATAFEELWLNTDNAHPLQSLWRRQDALATNELLNFGDAVEQLHREAPDWLRGQVDFIKKGDAGQSAGAIFEILALNLFSRQSCQVIPAPNSKPGFDGTLVMNDGARVLVSIKNHGLSTPEKQFLSEAKTFDEEFKSQLGINNLRDLEVNILATKHLDVAAFKSMKTDIANCLADVTQGKHGGELDRPYTIFLKGMTAHYGPLSAFGKSSGCRVMVPIAPNEQVNFEDAIRKGCANLHKHTKNETGDFCRMIILRLSSTASIAKCHEWAQWYFSNHATDPVDVIMLYQCAVTTDTSSDKSQITHYISTITGSRFTSWQTKKDGGTRSLPNLQVLVGVISPQQPRLLLIGDDGKSVDMSEYYMYQRADVYQKVEFSEGASVNLSNPASGIMLHAIFEQNGNQKMTLSSKAEGEKVLALLP